MGAGPLQGALTPVGHSPQFPRPLLSLSPAPPEQLIRTGRKLRQMGQNDNLSLINEVGGKNVGRIMFCVCMNI